jgi:hypothetical protein
MPLTGPVPQGRSFFCPRCGALYAVTYSRPSSTDNDAAKCVDRTGLSLLPGSAPNRHDLRCATLRVGGHICRGGIDRPSRAAEIHPLGLSSIEKADLIAFLETLTGRPDLVPSPVLPH